MHFEYFQPRADLRQYVGSYYHVSVLDDISDIMRAEIANIRFVLNGYVSSNINGKMEAFSTENAILCGPTYKASQIRFRPNTQVLGAAITPLGWAHMIDQGADKFADKLVPLSTVLPQSTEPILRAVFDKPDIGQQVRAMDDLFASLISPSQHIHEDFLEMVTQWITSPDPNELSDLMKEMTLSTSQVERLCKAYFGSPPKKLHRKFRALHSANRLTWQDLTDWRDIATTAYFDQSHFIREFKQFNGRTPSEFIKGAHILVRLTLQERLQIAHESPFSLVG